MTNGEKLISDFPYIEIKGQDEVFTTIQIDTTGTGTPIIVYTEWWNAEYIEPTTKKDLTHNLCDSCKNIGCVFQSGIVRTECAFYMPPLNKECVDCVSRRAVNSLIWKYLRKETDDNIAFYEHFLELPSVTPIRPKGHWIECMPEGAEEWCYKCSECNFWKYKKTINLSRFNFCPNCGAKMESEVENGSN